MLVDAVTRVPADAWGEAALYSSAATSSTSPRSSYASGDPPLGACRGAAACGSWAPTRAPTCRALMREVDWIIVPSTWWENAPVVIQEAFHHGRPIIASRHRRHGREGARRLDGLHFRAGSPNSLPTASSGRCASPACGTGSGAGSAAHQRHRGRGRPTPTLYERCWTPRVATRPDTAGRMSRSCMDAAWRDAARRGGGRRRGRLRRQHPAAGRAALHAADLRSRHRVPQPRHPDRAHGARAGPAPVPGHPRLRPRTSVPGQRANG